MEYPRLKIAIGSMTEDGPRILRAVDVTDHLLSLSQDDPERVRRWSAGKELEDITEAVPLSLLTPDEAALLRNGELFLAGFHKSLESFLSEIANQTLEESDPVEPDPSSIHQVSCG